MHSLWVHHMSSFGSLILSCFCVVIGGRQSHSGSCGSCGYTCLSFASLGLLVVIELQAMSLLSGCASFLWVITAAVQRKVCAPPAQPKPAQPGHGIPACLIGLLSTDRVIECCICGIVGVTLRQFSATYWLACRSVEGGGQESLHHTSSEGGWQSWHCVGVSGHVDVS